MTLVDISEIGRSAKSYCEHTARTQPTLSDIVVTLVEMGKSILKVGSPGRGSLWFSCLLRILGVHPLYPDLLLVRKL